MPNSIQFWIFKIMKQFFKKSEMLKKNVLESRCKIMKSRKMLKSRVSSIIREFFCDLFALFRVKKKLQMKFSKFSL